MSFAGDEPLFPYVAPLIDEARAGQGSGHMHLGYWPEPPGRISAADWRAAQDRLSALVLDLSDLRDGQHIADIACGLGGTLRAISERVRPARLYGVNVDPAQLQLCPSDIAELHLADATELPFADAHLDRMICLEAAFHFADRGAFLRSAARCLKPGGRLVLADILLQPGPLTEGERADLVRLLARDFGRWPQPWISVASLQNEADLAGFAPVAHRNITAQTRPSHAVICRTSESATPQSGVEALRFLHQQGFLHYGIFVLERRAGTA